MEIIKQSDEHIYEINKHLLLLLPYTVEQVIMLSNL